MSQLIKFHLNISISKWSSSLGATSSRRKLSFLLEANSPTMKQKSICRTLVVLYDNFSSNLLFLGIIQCFWKDILFTPFFHRLDNFWLQNRKGNNLQRLYLTCKNSSYSYIHSIFCLKHTFELPDNSFFKFARSSSTDELSSIANCKKSTIYTNYHAKLQKYIGTKEKSKNFTYNYVIKEQV